MESIILTQISYSAAAIWILQKMKKCNRIPWITEYSRGINRLVAIIMSALAAIGVHFTHTWTFLDGGTVTVAIPGAAVLLAGLVHWFQSFALQEAMYIVLQKSEPVIVPAVQITTHDVTTASNRLEEKDVV